MVSVNAWDKFQEDNERLIDFKEWIIVLINIYPIISYLINKLMESQIQLIRRVLHQLQV